jgi:hypothetical protein
MLPIQRAHKNVAYVLQALDGIGVWVLAPLVPLLKPGVAGGDCGVADELVFPADWLLPLALASTSCRTISVSVYFESFWSAQASLPTPAPINSQAGKWCLVLSLK